MCDAYFCGENPDTDVIEDAREGHCLLRVLTAQVKKHGEEEFAASKVYTMH